MPGASRRSGCDANDPSATLARNFCCDAQRRPCATAWLSGPKPEEGPLMRRREFITLLGGAAQAFCQLLIQEQLACRATDFARLVGEKP